MIKEYLLAFICYNLGTFAQECPEFPQITLQDYYPETNYTFLGDGNSTLYFPEQVFVILRCTSSQPVYWDYDNPQLRQYRFIRPSRTSTDPLDPKTFCFNVDIYLYSMRKSTGKYSCRTLQEPSNGTTLSLFVDDDKGSPFVSTEMRPRVAEGQVKDGWLSIPCKVRNPEFQVELLHTQQGEEEIVNASVLRWDPSIGFLVNTRQYPEYGGKYTCKTVLSNRTYNTSIIIKYEAEAPVPKVTLEQVPGRGYVCETDNSVAISQLIYKPCNNLMECWNTEKRESGNDMTGFKESLSFVLRSPFDVNQLEFAGGVVQCIVGDSEPFGRTAEDTRRRVPFSKNVYQFAPLQTAGDVVILEDENVNKTLLTRDGINAIYTPVKIEPIPKTVIHYVGETYEFSCSTGRFQVAEGTDWVFGMKDGNYVRKNDELVTCTEEHGQAWEISRWGHSFWSKISVKLWSPDIFNVTCMAPMWSTYEWFTSTVRIHVNNSTTPGILSPAQRTPKKMSFGLDENATLSCTADGIPAPVFVWEKAGSSELPAGAKPSNNLDRASMKSTTTLKFRPVTKETEGEYICRATNAGGSDERTFKVLVKGNNGALIGTIVGALVAMAILLSLVAFLYKRIIHQRKIIGQILSEKELQEFFDGDKEMLNSKNCNLPEYCQFMPYNKDYDIPQTNVQIDQTLLLGSGQYGMVYKGLLAINQEQEQVAIKTVKPTAEKEYLKALLQEIKIMMLVGGHANVVNFRGAVTENLRDGKLLIVIEFCSLGSMEHYLQKNRDRFLNLIENDTILPSPKERRVSVTQVESHEWEDSLNTGHLVKWAHQIASGMEYLESRKVVHADLACRNVLLTADKVAKITDFGLSRQLYQNLEYVKKTQVPLPWRHMAIESLKDMSFSSASDVWSYGVTLWELFSLGAVPYPGYMWDLDFLKKLEAGFRMAKPENATREIYEIMLDCWNYDPTSRPSFEGLRNCFQAMVPKTDREARTLDYYRVDLP